MVFSSTFFLCGFLTVVIFLYFICTNLKYRNGLLFAASLFFYAWGEPKNVFLLLASVLLNYCIALAISECSPKDGKAKALLMMSVLLNCGALVYYKYLNFFVQNINVLLEMFTAGSVQISGIKNVALPIGISFFTFQAMSYVIDVYRGTAPVQRNIVNFGLYLAFFPQLIAGPIVRYQTIAEQISERHTSIDSFYIGMKRFVIGLSKKVLIANTVAAIADYSFSLDAASNLGFWNAWMGAVCYTLQIYFDFSGYSDMAIGLGRVFGFEFSENFNYPYAASSITDFWRRWHISLSSWFRDYIYIPLGGSRSGKVRLYRNLLIVWLCTGIWHGANWTFICWGLIYFIFASLEKMLKIEERVRNRELLSLLYRLFTLLVVMLCWVIFRADNVTVAVNYIAAMFRPTAFVGSQYMTKRYLCVILLSIFLSQPILRDAFARIKNNVKTDSLNYLSDICSLMLLLVCLATTVSSTYNPFIYFNF